MLRPFGTPEDRSADRIAHLNTLRGLIANRDAIESVVAPSDWRHLQLRRIRNREDALEKIAMSIDPPWLRTDVEEVVFMDELHNEVKPCRQHKRPHHLALGCTRLRVTASSYLKTR